MGPKFYKKKFASSGQGTKEKTVNDEATYLIIVESPSKCEKIESYLGSQYCCIASKGHIRTIEGIKAIDTKGTFEPKFTLISEKKGHVEWMHKIISRFSKPNIILASDDDREGEAIAWHICQEFDLPVETTKRIIFHEVTKPALLESVKTPTIINMDLVKAQHARQVLDIIVGYKISPYLWKYIFNSKSNTLSAGRCQTPALRLVYDNEKEANEPETKYKTVGTFFSQHIKYELNREFDKGEEVLDFLEKSKGHKYSLTIGEPKKSIRGSPKPFNTSRLLQASNNVLHISPKETMEVCQKLYQSGFITYMRTESSQYSPVFLEKMKEYIGSQYGEKYLGNIEDITNKDNGNPHEAIRVTNIELDHLQSSESRLSSMYRLIWKNTVESCMANAEYNNIISRINAPLDLEYHHTIEIPIFVGWKIVGEKGVDDEQTAAGSLLLYLKSIKGTTINHEWIESAVVVRNKRQHYSESTLIHKLEDLGIGRPSTFASIVDTIVERGYVKKTDIEGARTQCHEYKLIENNIESIIREKVFGSEKNKLVIQPTGILAIEFLLKTFERMFSYDYTKTMELDLDLVSSGKESDWKRICANCLKEIRGLSKEIKDLSKQTFPIDKDHELIFAPFGPIIKHKNADEEKSEFLQVKKELKLDLERARRGEYTLEDLIEIKNNYLGEHEGELVYLRTGKFGPYIECGKRKESVKTITKPLNQICLEDVIPFLSNSQQKPEANILRRLTEHMSVRKGKFGPYVFYQRPDMKKPEFYNIKKFNEGFFNCEAETLVNWIKDTYGITM
jgi:DNA topoisomerase-1